MERLPKTYFLKNGHQIAIRTLFPSDAEEFIAHKINVAKTTIFMNRLPEEVSIDVEATKEAIINSINEPRFAFVGAFDDNRLIGSFALRPVLNLQKTVHRASFGISVDYEYRGLGVGKILVQEMIDTAEEIGFEQIELDVVSTNNVARHLYESFGFTYIGHIPHAYKLKDGTYLDFELMVKNLKKIK